MSRIPKKEADRKKPKKSPETFTPIPFDPENLRAKLYKQSSFLWGDITTAKLVRGKIYYPLRMGIRTAKHEKLHIDRAVGLLTNPEKLLDVLGRKPQRILHDPAFALVIEVLGYFSLTHESDLSKWSTNLLRRARLSGFMPRDTPKRRHTNKWLHFWGSYPGHLLDVVSELQKRIRPFLQSRYKTVEWEKKYCDIEKAYKELYGNSLPMNFKFKEKDRSLATVAVFFLSNNNNIPFDGLYKVYTKALKDPIKLGPYLPIDPFLPIK